MALVWKKEYPTKVGWYFWRQRRTMCNPMKWSTYFVSETEGVYCRIFGVRGGWWAGPIVLHRKSLRTNK